MQMSKHLNCFARIIVFYLALGTGSVFAGFLNISKNVSVLPLYVTLANGNTQTGFAVVSLEKNGVLYLLTAAHVVKDEQGNRAANIMAIINPDKFPKYLPVQNRMLLRLEDDIKLRQLDIVVLQLDKPKGFTWNYGQRVQLAQVGASAIITAKDGMIMPRVEENKGRISDIESNGKIIVTMNAAQRGVSGGPLYGERGILGIITSDESKQVVAVDYGMLLEILNSNVLGKSDFKSKSIFPTVSAGVTVFPLSAPLSMNPMDFNDYTKGDNRVAFFQGQYFIWHVNRFFDLKLARSNYFMAAKKNEALPDQETEFRNEFTLNSLAMQYVPFSQRSDYYFQKGGGYILLEIYQGTAQLQLGRGGSERIELKQYTEFAGDYSNKLLGFGLGVGICPPQFKWLHFCVNTKFAFFNNKYMHIDLDTPFATNSLYDVELIFDINMALTPKKKIPTIKTIW